MSSYRTAGRHRLSIIRFQQAMATAIIAIASLSGATDDAKRCREADSQFVRSHDWTLVGAFGGGGIIAE